MSYFPRILPPEQKELDLVELMQSRHWHRVKFDDIKKNDRILVTRTANGTRLIVESVVRSFNRNRGAWVNSLGTPVVSCLDTQIFRSGEYRNDQSEECSDLVLGD